MHLSCVCLSALIPHYILHCPSFPPQAASPSHLSKVKGEKDHAKLKRKGLIVVKNLN